MQNIVINVCEKFHYDRLRNDRALGNVKSDNNKNPNNKNKNNVRSHWWPVSGPKMCKKHLVQQRRRGRKTLSLHMQEWRWVCSCTVTFADCISLIFIRRDRSQGQWSLLLFSASVTSAAYYHTSGLWSVTGQWDIASAHTGHARLLTSDCSRNPVPVPDSKIH